MSQPDRQPRPTRAEEIRRETKEVTLKIAQSDVPQEQLLMAAYVAVIGALGEIAAQLAEINSRDTAAEYRAKAAEQFVEQLARQSGTIWTPPK